NRTQRRFVTLSGRHIRLAGLVATVAAAAALAATTLLLLARAVGGRVDLLVALRAVAFCVGIVVMIAIGGLGDACRFGAFLMMLAIAPAAPAPATLALALAVAVLRVVRSGFLRLFFLLVAFVQLDVDDVVLRFLNIGDDGNRRDETFG